MQEKRNVVWEFLDELAGRGWQMRQVALEAGLDESTLSHIRRGERRPSWETLIALLRAFPELRERLPAGEVEKS